ncbi:MAG: ZIP family metal transporter, partial [Caulobacteraceae bacterium]
MTLDLPAGHRLDLLLIGLGVAAGAATLAGGWLALRLAKKIHLILGFSAGAVIGVALFDLLPEALALGSKDRGPAGVTAIVAVGFLAYLVVDRAFLIASTDRAGHRGHLGAGALTLHSLLDGLAIGLGFQVSLAVGAVLAIAVLAHDFSDGINTVTLSMAGSGRPRVARRWLIADAAAPLVGIAASRLISPPRAELAGALAAFAGFFLYIGASELLPESNHRHPRAWTTVATVLGAALIWTVVKLAGLYGLAIRRNVGSPRYKKSGLSPWRPIGLWLIGPRPTPRRNAHDPLRRVHVALRAQDPGRHFREGSGGGA